MEIVVTHLTRMRRGYVCTAGLTAEGQHVRPVFERGNLGVNMLARNGGPLALGRRLSLLRAQPVECDRPHVEDWTIDREGARAGEALPPAQFWALLAAHAHADVRQAFGPELRRLGATSFGSSPGQGATSLSYLRLRSPLELHLVERESGTRQIRARFHDEGAVDLGVTDKRLYVGHAHLPNEALVTRLQEALAKSAEVIIAVGLGRPYPPGDPAAMNWLQLNNIFPREAPLWEKVDDLRDCGSPYTRR